MTQIAVPTSDISTGVWTPTPVWSRVDEAVTGNGDDVDSDASPAITETCEVGLSTISDPNVDTGHKIRFSAWKDSGGANYDIDMMLVEGTTVVGTVTQQVLTTSEAEYLLEISSAAVTDYSDLRIRWAAYKNGGGANRAVHVGYTRLETPDAAQQYSIAGAVTLAFTIAATLVHNINPALAGAVTTNLTPAATLEHNINPAIAGAVTTSLTPAATMEYAANYAIDGDVTMGLTPAAALEHNINPAIAGDVTLILTPDGSPVRNLHPEFVGDVTLVMDPEGFPEFNRHAAIDGAVTMSLVPDGSPLYTEAGASNYVIDGDVTLTLVPDGSPVRNLHPELVGAVQTDFVIAGGMVYTLNRELSGDVGLVLTPAAAFEHNIAPAYIGDVVLTLTPHAVMRGPGAGMGWIWYGSKQGAGSADLPDEAKPQSKQGQGNKDHDLPTPWQGHAPGAEMRGALRDNSTWQGQGEADVS